MKARFTIALLALGLIGARFGLAALDPLAPWPTANRDLRHTSRAPFIGPQTLRVRWTFSPGDGATLWGPVVGRDGTIYVTSVDHMLYAVAPDGQEKWQFDLQDAPGEHPVIGDDGTIYATGLSLFAITPDGKQKWVFLAPGLAKFQSPTFGPDNTLYQPSNDGTLYAIDAATGKVKWSHQYDVGVRMQAPIGFNLKGQPVISLRQGGFPNVLQLDSQGNVLWSFTGPGGMRTATVGDDGTLYLVATNGGPDGSVFALNPTNGTLKWSQQVRDPQATQIEFPALGLDGTVYVGSANGELAAFTPSGADKWRFLTDPYITDPVTGMGTAVYLGTPIVDATGTLYVPSEDQDLWEISKDGKLLAKLDVPALFIRMAMGADGTIYSGSRNGTLYAFGEDFVLGDANGDGKVNVADAVVALRKVVGLSPTSLQDIRVLDVSPAGGNGRPFGDGRITIGDVIAILRQSVNPVAGWPYNQ